MDATTVPEPLPTWVVGSTGLLGSAVRRALVREQMPVRTSPIPWAEPEHAVRALLATAESLPESGWRIAWCAGSGVIATPQIEIDRELTVLREFLARWRPDAGEPGSRALFFASSAGGVYAGSTAPPFTEASTPQPISPYGHAKLAAEETWTEFAVRSGIPLLVGRLSNLFGPGQNLAKPQGLVSQLCKAHATGRPLSLYVPLDTMRDYLYADDAGSMVVAALEAIALAGDGVHVKLMVSGRSMTVNEVVGEVRRVTRRRPPVVMQPSSVARFQAQDLRMRSLAWPPLGGYVRTPFGAGLGACVEAVNAALRRSGGL